MSQHFLAGKDPANTILIGYDRPLNNFFGQVMEGADQDVTHWVPGEQTPEAMRDKMKEYVDIPDAVLATLKLEQRDRDIRSGNFRVDHRNPTKSLVKEGRFTGTVLHADADFVHQEVGRDGTVVHETKSLDRTRLRAGDVIGISYTDGRGMVMDKSQSRSKEMER